MHAQQKIWLIKIGPPFQFPSNGKAHVHGIIGGHKDDEVETVSIPFKRESTCAHGSVLSDISAVAKSFNSLQTGKHMCTKMLQSPEHFRRSSVSIPFKRESTCARPFEELRSYRSQRFQFPSNGKAHVHKMLSDSLNSQRKVSIPFKRESTCAPESLTMPK